MVDIIWSDYWLEFITIASVHFLAVASPGPDFAIVVKHSVSYGRKAAIYTSIGIGLGILLHVTYSLLGIGFLIATTPWLFNLLMYLAAAYLLFLGWGALQSKPNSEQLDIEDTSHRSISNKKAFLIGLVTNGLNPKATLFFLSIFAVAISTDTPTTVKMIYGVYLSLATGLWFCFLSSILSTATIRQKLLSNGYWFDRLMGAILIGLAVKLIIDSITGF